jgi:hypothetical protein
MVIGELRPPQPPCPGTLAVPGKLYVCQYPVQARIRRED